MNNNPLHGAEGLNAPAWSAKVALGFSDAVAPAWMNGVTCPRRGDHQSSKGVEKKPPSSLPSNMTTISLQTKSTCSEISRAQIFGSRFPEFDPGVPKSCSG